MPDSKTPAAKPALTLNGQLAKIDQLVKDSTPESSADIVEAVAVLRAHQDRLREAIEKAKQHHKDGKITAEQLDRVVKNTAFLLE